MFFLKALAAAALVSTAVSAAAPDPDPAPLIRGLNVTLSYVKELNATVNKFSPTNPANLDNAFASQVVVNKIRNALTYLTKLAKNTKGVYSDLESLDVAQAVVDLETPVNDTLKNIVRHKKYFTTAVLGFGDLSATVEYDLTNIRAQIGALGAAIEPHIDEIDRPIAPALTKEFQGLFNASIKAFAKCGPVCLPIITLLPGDGSVPGQGQGHGYGYGYHS